MQSKFFFTNAAAAGESHKKYTNKNVAVMDNFDGIGTFLDGTIIVQTFYVCKNFSRN